MDAGDIQNKPYYVVDDAQSFDYGHPSVGKGREKIIFSTTPSAMRQDCDALDLDKQFKKLARISIATYKAEESKTLSYSSLLKGSMVVALSAATIYYWTKYLRK